MKPTINIIQSKFTLKKFSNNFSKFKNIFIDQIEHFDTFSTLKDQIEPLAKKSI